MASEQTTKGYLLVEAAAGFTAGLVATAVLHPVDLVKVRLQATQKYALEQGTLISNAKHVIVHEGGLRALYRGLTPNVVGNSASWALYFFWYDVAKLMLNRLNGPNKPLGSRDYMAASAFSSLATSTLTNPIWVIKTRMLTTSTAVAQTRTMTNCIQEVYNSGGLRGFYRGLAPSLFGTLTFSIQFTLYEALKSWRGAKHTHELDTYDFVAFSAASKLVAGSMTYPYQVLRTRMQMFGARPEARTVRSLIGHIWRNAGPLGFYKGMVPSLLRVLPATCITFLVYEESRKGYAYALQTAKSGSVKSTVEKV